MKNDTKWTPGPWTADGYFVSSIYRSGFDIVDGAATNTRPVSESQANAHLIAAAPELYDALDNLLGVIYGDGGTKANALEIARAALVKARGYQQ